MQKETENAADTTNGNREVLPGMIYGIATLGCSYCLTTYYGSHDCFLGDRCQGDIKDWTNLSYHLTMDDEAAYPYVLQSSVIIRARKRRAPTGLSAS